MNLGLKIRELRKAHKMTQTELAAKLSIKQPNLNKWETGERNPSLVTLKKIARLFDISLDVLAFDERDLKIAQQKDKSLYSQLKDFEKLTDHEKETVLKMINALAERKSA